VLLALLSLALPQATEPGPVVLLGERADVARVDELTDLEGPSVLLWLEGQDGGGSAKRAAALGGGPATACLELARDDRIALDDMELARQVRGARHVAFGPAPLGDWFRTLWPRREESGLVRALWETHRGGAVLVGRGSSAGFLSAATVIDGPEEIGERERNPHRMVGPRAAWAAGFQPWAILDTAGAAAGRIERLVRVLIDERLRLGVMLEARSALVYDPPGARLVARGEDGVLILDLRTSRRRDDALYGARLTRLRPGDSWVRRLRAMPTPVDASEAEIDQREERRVDDVFSLTTLIEALSAFDESPAPRQLALDDGQRVLTLSIDDDAQVWHRDSGVTSLDRLTLDLTPSRP
jgi:hypothetical protein